MSSLKDWFGGTETTKETRDITRPSLAGLQDTLAGYLKQYIPGRGAYPGPTSVDVPQNVQAQLGLLQSDALQNARQPYLQDVISGQYLPGGQQGANPFLQSYIESAQRATAESAKYAFERQLPGIFAQGGQVADPEAGSSAFTRALGKAAFDYQQNLKDIATDIAFPAYQSERQLQQQAVPLSQQEVTTTIQNIGAQLIPAEIARGNIATALEAWKSASQGLAQLFASLSGIGSLTQVGQFGESETQKGIIPGIAGLVKSLPLAAR